MSKANKRISAQKVTQAVVTPFPKTDFNFEDEETNSFDNKFKNLSAIEYKTENQRRYWDLIGEKEMIFCSGPAGTGKSFISLARALQIFSHERKKFKKIVIVKPAVEADEKLGYLPGSMEEKLEPYIYSTKYVLEKILGKQKIENLFAKGKIEVMALAYMRGINVDNSILIFEEAQNSTPRQMKTILTRIGENSKFIISGDHEQSDRYKDTKESGLYFAMEKLKNIPEIGIFEFKPEDIVRNPLVEKILEKFNGDVK